jgi:hypothetical protein
MSQKSSVPQVAKSVSQALMPDTANADSRFASVTRAKFAFMEDQGLGL